MNPERSYHVLFGIELQRVRVGAFRIALEEETAVYWMWMDAGILSLSIWKTMKRANDSLL